jgi:hypothetical protein
MPANATRRIGSGLEGDTRTDQSQPADNACGGEGLIRIIDAGYPTSHAGADGQSTVRTQLDWLAADVATNECPETTTRPIEQDLQTSRRGLTSVTLSRGPRAVLLDLAVT